MGLAELSEEHSTTSITDTEQSKLINLLEVKQIDIGVNKMDCDSADIEQYVLIKNYRASTHDTLPARRAGCPQKDQTHQMEKVTELQCRCYFDKDVRQLTEAGCEIYPMK